MWRRVDPVKLTDVSEERIASIFRKISHDLHGATSQKMAFFIVTAVKTSTPTNPGLILIFLQDAIDKNFNL
jgi:hypothetical protein